MSQPDKLPKYAFPAQMIIMHQLLTASQLLRQALVSRSYHQLLDSLLRPSYSGITPRPLSSSAMVGAPLSTTLSQAFAPSTHVRFYTLTARHWQTRLTSQFTLIRATHSI